MIFGIFTKKGHKLPQKTRHVEDFTKSIKSIRGRMPHIYLDVPKYQEWVKELKGLNPQVPEKSLNPIGMNDMTCVVKPEVKLLPNWALIAYTAFEEVYDLQAKELYYDKSTKFYKLLNSLANEGKVGAFFRKVRRFMGMK